MIFGLFCTDEDGHFVVYSKPPGALRGTRAFNRTVFFRETKSNCSYTVSKAVMTSELPLGLTTLLGVGDQSYCVGFDVCRGLKYVDTYFNRETDEWFEPIANANGLPDNITLLVDHQTHVPFWATRYHPGHPGTFDPPRRITTKTNIVSNSPDVIFKLPPQWQSSCRNLDARIYTDSKDVFYSTPSGSDYIHIWLSDMPVGGDVTITFLAHPIPPCPCVTCVRFEPNPIRFTSVDYRRKQIVRFVYEKDGVTNFTFVVSGGGYYNRTSEEYGTVYTCHRGIPRKSC